jgi:predicted RNA-binding protein YlqC (UPF0109 family)
VKEVLEYVARSLVDNPDAVEVTEVPGERSTVYRLKVDREDMGKVIGRGGRNARAIRTVMKAAGHRAGTNAIVEIVE